MSSPVVAIDGPAASGKGTLSKQLALALGYDHLDTGLLYRAVARKIVQACGDPSDPELAGRMARELSAEDMAAPGLRGEAMGRVASICSGIPGVRAALLDYQLNFASNPPSGRGAVLDGRDIGTQVCPGADLKIWMTADPEVRAARRQAEDPKGPSYAEVLAAVKERDDRESKRAISPLIPAADAVVIDTTAIGAQAAFEAAIALAEPLARRAKKPSAKI